MIIFKKRRMFVISRFSKYDAILAAVQSVPSGRVATYGQIAEAAGLPGRARLVGRVLGKLPRDSGVPWHRIVNAKGQISLRNNPDAAMEQQMLLIEEGIHFNTNDSIPLARFLWRG